ncbi:uncharacterized protein N7487_004993 [Penicillium crustosum]|uniref:uncharacterized protein n=1 Tax=Penicillium crustosum TaxID=36656 RepID=UPI00238AF2EC|nr:uncharacterized protein N7487_004993 [Penicillium crustosum]KAJ5410634.1 hypothetical protein N7487_004993 [Penicillium crustosum]
MFNPELKALDIESSWNQIIPTNQTPSAKTLDQTPISSIGSGIAPTLPPENSTVNTRPPRVLSQLQKWDRANSRNSEKSATRLYTLDASHMMSPAVSVELISV